MYLQITPDVVVECSNIKYVTFSTDQLSTDGPTTFTSFIRIVFNDDSYARFPASKTDFKMLCSVLTSSVPAC